MARTAKTWMGDPKGTGVNLITRSESNADQATGRKMYPQLKSGDFCLLGEDFGADVERAVSAALKAGAVFPGGGDALAIFRNTLAASIRDIENDERGRLFQRFLRDRMEWLS